MNAIRYLCALFLILWIGCASSQYIVLDRVPKDKIITKIDTIRTPDGNMYKIWFK